jgi:acyl-CoA reductase-like NAD-dependent aldehyde dehydrogenase
MKGSVTLVAEVSLSFASAVALDCSKALKSVAGSLTASIWTNDLSTAMRTAKMVQSGFVWINEVSRHFLGVRFGG